MSISETRDPLPSGRVGSASPGDEAGEVRSLLDDQRRVVSLEAVHNFRDLGGYRLGDGRTIRWGRLFRSDGLHHATTTDVTVFDALGLRTVVDLRSSGETAENGSFPVAQHPVDYHHLPIIDSTWNVDNVPEFADDHEGEVEFLVWAYDDMLERGAGRFADAIHVLALADAMPAVFHCAAGKDRTGLLAALLLGALEVDQQVILGDYALTAAGMQRFIAWHAARRAAGATQHRDVPSALLAAHPEALAIVLDRLVARNGSLASYVHDIGVGPETVGVIADRLTA